MALFYGESERMGMEFESLCCWYKLYRGDGKTGSDVDDAVWFGGSKGQLPQQLSTQLSSRGRDHAQYQLTCFVSP
jgi:hypothetical protein